MNDLSALIERVESGTGSDRGLDEEIHDACGGEFFDRHAQWKPAPLLTSSLDAVLSLIEAKLPRWAIAEMKDGIRHEDGSYCHVRLWCPVNSALGYKYPSNAPTPARAALAAALRAIQESRRHHDR